MSHPKVREYTKWYNLSYQEPYASAKERTAPAQPPYASCDTPPARRQGLQLSYELARQLNHERHHVQGHDELATTAKHQQRRYLFSSLPGRTFNDKTWEAFTFKATQLQAARATRRR